MELWTKTVQAVLNLEMKMKQKSTPTTLFLHLVCANMTLNTDTVAERLMRETLVF